MLPQTHAFVLETFRWRPVTAGGAYQEGRICRNIYSQPNQSQDLPINRRKILSGFATLYSCTPHSV
jgi:hypothetical protein